MAKSWLLGGEGLAEQERIALEGFPASSSWVKKFVRRHGYRSKLFSGEGCNVDEAAIGAAISELHAVTLKEYDLPSPEQIFTRQRDRPRL